MRTFLIVALLLAPAFAVAQAPVRCGHGALTERDIPDLLDLPEARMRLFITTCGINFPITSTIERRFRQAGVSTTTIELLREKAPKPKPIKLPDPPPQPPPDAIPARVIMRVNQTDSQLYVWIPPGPFLMGCSPNDSECSDDERPPHIVAITQGFWLSQTLVTVTSYRTYARANDVSLPDGQSGDRHPVIGVTWNEAAAYCQWAGARLPTEAEWEYAARGGTSTARYGILEQVAWYDANSGGDTQEVARKPANGYGLYDILGNAWEWVEDWYDPDYYRLQVATDPRGPALGTTRVLRGGSWSTKLSRNMRATTRFKNAPNSRNSNVGFRCAWDYQ